MRTFRLGLLSAIGLLGLVVFRMAGRDRRRTPRRHLPFMRLLPEDGFGGPGVFERAVASTPVEAHVPPSPVEEVSLPLPRRAIERPSSRSTAARKPAARKSPAKTSAVKKTVVKKAAAKKTVVKKAAAKKPVAKKRPSR